VSWPLGCDNNGPNVGIDSTPVIDITSNTIYLIAYTQDSTGPAYRIHALDLGNLTDKVNLAGVSASHTPPPAKIAGPVLRAGFTGVLVTGMHIR
jgi:hypothetical protein